MTTINISNKTEIYTAYYPKVLQYLRSRMNNAFDAEDLAQTVFLKVYEKLDTFDETKSALSTWIYCITRNTLTDHRRAMAFRSHGELPEILPDGSSDLSEGLILEEEQKWLAAALEKLETEERDLIVLRYMKEYTLTDIAELMNRPYGQIKRLHAKVLQKLQRSMLQVL